MSEKQIYSTKTSRYILEFLQNNHNTAVTASDVMLYLESLNLSVNLTTVYRQLNRLAEQQKAVKLKGKHGKTVFQLAKKEKSCEDHIHVQCTKCGKLIHLDCHFMTELETHLESHHGFNLKCEGSILYGLCKNCAEK